MCNLSLAGISLACLVLISAFNKETAAAKEAGAACCSPDLVVLVDRAYVGPKIYLSTVKPFIATFSSSIPSCADMRGALVEFGDNTRISFGFGNDRASFGETFEAYALGTSEFGIDSDLGVALRATRRQLVEDLTSGHRPDSPTGILVITGHNPGDRILAENQANLLKQYNVQIMIIALGADVDSEYLQSLASSPYFFRQYSDDLIPDEVNVAALIYNQLLCPAISTTPTTTTTTSVPVLSDITSSSNENKLDNAGASLRHLSPSHSSGTCCAQDVAIFIDRNGIGPKRFDNFAKPFLQNALRQIPDCADFQGAVIEYASQAQVRFGFTELITLSTISYALDQFAVSTNTLGLTSDLGAAIKTARSQLLENEASGHRLNGPTTAIIIVGQNPSDLDGAVKQINLLKQNNITVVVIGYGSGYDAITLKTLASKPKYFRQLDVDQDFSADSSFVSGVLCPSSQPSIVNVDSPQTDAATTKRRTTTTTTTAEPPTIANDLPPAISAEQQFSSTRVVPSSVAKSNATSNDFCCKQDLIILIDRVYMGPVKYRSYISPLINAFAEHLPSCLSLRAAVVEFGSTTVINFNFADYASAGTNALLSLKLTSNDWGTDASLAMAFRTIRLQLADGTLQGRRPNVPLSILILTGSDPFNKAAAQVQANLLKQSNVKILAMGLGYAVNTPLLQSVVSQPDYLQLFADNAVADVFGETQELYRQLCSALPSTSAVPTLPAVTTETDLPNLSTTSPPAPQTKTKTTTTTTVMTTVMITTTAEPVINIGIAENQCCAPDVVILIDRSYVGPARFSSYVQPILSSLPKFISKCSDARIAVAEFSTNVQVRFNLGDNGKASISSALQSLTLGPGELAYTNDLAGALKVVRTQMLTSSKGHRSASPTTIVVITGNDPLDRPAAQIEVNRLKQKDAKFLVIGLGDAFNSTFYQSLTFEPRYFRQLSNSSRDVSSQARFIGSTLCEKIGPFVVKDSSGKLEADTTEQPTTAPTTAPTTELTTTVAPATTEPPTTAPTTTTTKKATTTPKKTTTTTKKTTVKTTTTVTTTTTTPVPTTEQTTPTTPEKTTTMTKKPTTTHKKTTTTPKKTTTTTPKKTTTTTKTTTVKTTTTVTTTSTTPVPTTEQTTPTTPEQTTEPSTPPTTPTTTKQTTTKATTTKKTTTTKPKTSTSTRTTKTSTKRTSPSKTTSPATGATPTAKSTAAKSTSPTTVKMTKPTSPSTSTAKTSTSPKSTATTPKSMSSVSTPKSTSSTGSTPTTATPTTTTNQQSSTTTFNALLRFWPTATTATTKAPQIFPWNNWNPNNNAANRNSPNTQNSPGEFPLNNLAQRLGFNQRPSSASNNNSPSSNQPASQQSPAQQSNSGNSQSLFLQPALANLAHSVFQQAPLGSFGDSNLGLSLFNPPPVPNFSQLGQSPGANKQPQQYPSYGGNNAGQSPSMGMGWPFARNQNNYMPFNQQFMSPFNGAFR